jgi:hypothetical protein
MMMTIMMMISIMIISMHLDAMGSWGSQELEMDVLGVNTRVRVASYSITACGRPRIFKLFAFACVRKSTLDKSLL